MPIGYFFAADADPDSAAVEVLFNSDCATNAAGTAPDSARKFLRDREWVEGFPDRGAVMDPTIDRAGSGEQGANPAGRSSIVATMRTRAARHFPSAAVRMAMTRSMEGWGSRPSRG